MNGDADVHDDRSADIGGSGDHGGERGGARGFLRRYVPITSWLPSYRREWFSGDVVSAISVWALLVPQSLAYSSIAGVPVQYGLYAAFASLVAYALFGTSRQLVQGPSAAVAAVSAAAILPIVGADAMGTKDAVATTAALAITTGVVYLLLGVARMGWVSNFLSKAVMSGFVLGFAIGIIIDQSHKLLGVDSTDGSYWDILVGTIQEIPDTNMPTLALGFVSLAALLAMRRYAPRLPRALIVMVLSIIAVTALDLTAHGVARDRDGADRPVQHRDPLRFVGPPGRVARWRPVDHLRRLLGDPGRGASHGDEARLRDRP